MQVTAVIPAFNEENTIAEIITVLKVTPMVNEVLVVSDGSTDRTAQVARNAGARVIELKHNIGKGGAMKHGVESTDADIILFLDADLIGLTPIHVVNLLLPVIDGQVEATVGVFGQGRMATDLAQTIAPFLSGQRAIRREIIIKVPNMDLARFGIEVLINRYLKEAGISIREVELIDMSHIMKEEKRGLIHGFTDRMKMYWEIAKLVK